MNALSRPRLPQDDEDITIHRNNDVAKRLLPGLYPVDNGPLPPDLQEQLDRLIETDKPNNDKKEGP